MRLTPAVTRTLAQAIAQVEQELTAHLQSAARDAGVPEVEAQSLDVRFTDGEFVGWTTNDDFLEREFGRPGVAPPLGLLRRWNARATQLAAPMLDHHAGRLLQHEGLL